MPLLVTVLWVSAAWLTFGALASIGQIGKERKPLTSGVAISVVITTAVIVSALVASALLLA